VRPWWTRDYHWYQRYHASDGNDVWGGRSTLAFTDGQTNGEVLAARTDSMLDVMTANRDPRVGRVSKGGDLRSMTATCRKPVPVISNVGGKQQE
jgi:hypothetical protein